MFSVRTQVFALHALTALCVATLYAPASAQTASTATAPVVNTAAIDRMSVKPPVSLAPRGKPRTQSTWCRATGTQPASKMVPRGSVSFGKGVLLDNQIGACAARPAGL